MKKIKKYVNFEDLNEEEQRTNSISYARLIDRVCNNLILCNKITEIDDLLYDNIVIGEIYDEANDQYIDIYQYFIIDIDDYTIEQLKDLKCNDLIIAYSETLEQYILMVDHYGTSWDYVMTSIEPTENIDEADL